MFHWWYVPVFIFLLLLFLILFWLFSMHRNMPWQNCLAIFGNLKLKLPPALHRYALSGPRDYSTLPDPLRRVDGSPVTDKNGFGTRREEILSLFEQSVYGPYPKDGFSTSFQTVEEGEALNGAAIRRQVKITVSTARGSCDSLMLLYLPKAGCPSPVILGLNFRGNHTVLADEAILPSPGFDTSDGKWTENRGKAAYRWNVADCVARGYGVATIYSGDLAPDSKVDYASRVIGLFDLPEFKAIGAWAFGIFRGVDYLLQDSAVDPGRIAVIGHSRLGKAAVWAGANDSRISLVISNCSGNSGASLSRGHHGETLYSITKAFPHWFSSQYAQYANQENELPVDQNLLLAAIAPRKLYVASAWDDLWADPQGAFNSLRSAQGAFALYYGEDILPDSMETYPPIGQGFACPAVGAHLRAGGHDVLPEDWRFYLNYMDQYWQ